MEEAADSGQSLPGQGKAGFYLTPNLQMLERSNKKLESELMEMRFRPEKRKELQQRLETYAEEKLALQHSGSYRNIIKDNRVAVWSWTPPIRTQSLQKKFAEDSDRIVQVLSLKSRQDEEDFERKLDLWQQKMQRGETSKEDLERQAKALVKLKTWLTVTSFTSRLQTLIAERKRHSKLHKYRAVLWRVVHKLCARRRYELGAQLDEKRLTAAMKIQKVCRKRLLTTGMTRRLKYVTLLVNYLRENENQNKVKDSIKRFVDNCKLIQKHCRAHIGAVESRIKVGVKQWEKYEIKLNAAQRRNKSNNKNSPHFDPLDPWESLNISNPHNPRSKGYTGKKKQGTSPRAPATRSAPVSTRQPYTRGQASTSLPALTQPIRKNYGDIMGAATVPKQIKTELIQAEVRRQRSEFIVELQKWQDEMEEFERHWQMTAAVRNARFLVTGHQPDPIAEIAAKLAHAPNKGKPPRWTPLLSKETVDELHKKGLKMAQQQAAASLRRDIAAKQTGKLPDIHLHN